ncbi:MAG: glycerophosphodiester phosphodiesterase [Chloroflexi bacterium]|nr:glycerophosphodiester phosphodiesterase [Chloroflexota bacterium]
MQSDHPADRRGLYTIAHRAGNNLHALELALESGVDAIECDFWHDHGRLTLRHERKLPAVPLFYDKWILRWSMGHLSLPDLLREIDFRAALFLDIKSASPAAAAAFLDLYRDHASMMPAVLVSSPQWKLLDRLAAADAGLRLCYSIGARRQLDALLLRARQALPPYGTSIRHSLLSRDVIDQLHDARLMVYAWTVNTPHRAEELRSWGVDGLISDDLEVLRM